jgi:uncharacterized circularly permuted ATP-grasp superfamily protein
LRCSADGENLGAPLVFVLATIWRFVVRHSPRRGTDAVDLCIGPAGDERLSHAEGLGEKLKDSPWDFVAQAKLSHGVEDRLLLFAQRWAPHSEIWF